MSKQELELPKGWVETKLDNFTIIIQGQSPPGSTYNDRGEGLPFFQGKAEFNELYPTIKKWCTQPKKVAEKEDILLCVRAGTGAINFNPEKSCIGRGIAAIRTLCDVPPFYIINFLKILTEEFRGRGTTITGISSVDLKNIQIPIAPLKEQKRIVSKIEELFSKIDSAKQSLEHTKLQLEQYRQSLFKSLFNKTTNFVSLEECSKIGTGGTPSRQKPEYYGGNISWVKTTEVQNSHIKNTSEKITELGLKNSNAKIHPKNSVIIAMYGDGKTRGQCAILDIDASTNQACGVIICDDKKLLYKFCFYWFLSQYDQMRLKSSGGNQSNLNLGIIKKTKIPLPSLEEQEQIVSQIEQSFSLIENTTQIVNSTLQKLQTMKMSVLKQAFEGKLVPQDPNDEPAQVLLDKIKSTKDS